MINVLFVDDDDAVLEGLENRLHRLRDRWQMHFARGPEQALEQLQRSPMDVIVTDMRMPGMDGGQLLDRVREQYPETVRIILSGQTGTEGAMRLMPVAHQILAKPCDAQTLERAIECCAGLQARRERPEVRQAIGLLRSLPALPRLYWDLVRELDRPLAESASIASIIEQDVAMTARLLQLANSAFFSSTRQIRTVKDAVTLLGLLPIRSIALNLHLFRAMSHLCAPKGFSLEQLQNHSFKSAQLAAQMLSDADARKTAYSVAMMHDIGILAMVTGMPEAYCRTRQIAAQTRESIHRVEQRELGCDHAQIGGQMLALWGLPMPLVEAVVYHHEPARSGETTLGPVTAVHIASHLAHVAAAESLPEDGLDQDHLQRLGLDTRVTRWQQGEPITAPDSTPRIRTGVDR